VDDENLGDLLNNFQQDESVNWKNKGNEFYKQADYNNALKCFNQALQINPTYLDAWNNLGLTFYKMGKLEESRKCLEKIKNLKIQQESEKINPQSFPEDRGQMKTMPKIPVEDYRPRNINEDNKTGIIQPMIRVIIALISLAVINFIILSLPGLKNLNIPGNPLPWSIPTIISAVISTLMIITVLRFGFDFGPTLRKAYPKFPELQTVAIHATILISITIAYGAYQSILLPYFYPNDWIYHLLFLGMALIPTYVIASTLLRHTDKWTGYIYWNVKKGGGSIVQCTRCGEMNDSINIYCRACGNTMK